jgi:2-alkyl-3-oxoalkanoate reductase
MREGSVKLLNLVSYEFKQKLKRSCSDRTLSASDPMQTVAAASKPVISQIMSILQQSLYQLPFTKAEQILGYQPIISFQEGCDRSIKWLAEVERFQSLIKTKDERSKN